MIIQQYNTDLKPKKKCLVIIILLIFISGAFVYYFRNDLLFFKNYIIIKKSTINKIEQENENKPQSNNVTLIAVQLTDNFSNESIDTNGDGLNDVLRIKVEINVNKDGKFSFSTKLNAKDSKMITFVNKDIVLETGINTLFFDFDGIDIRESGIDGPYNVLILCLNPYGDVIDAREFITADYKSSAFKIKDAAFTDQYSISREDINNDTKYDSLIFNIGVNINVSGNYIIEGGLYDKNGDIIDNVYDNVYLEKNNGEVQLKFDGKRINSSKINGPYSLRYLGITKESLVDFRLDAKSTSKYKYTDFQSH